MITSTAAVVAVLTQRLLLSLIASFQRGPQGVLVPLLQRLVDDGFVRCIVRVHRVGWCDWRESHRIATLLCANVRPTNAWTDRATPEAIAQYDRGDLHVLRTVIAATVFTATPARATQRLFHCVTEAAAAFGRVDMLHWLNAQHNVFALQPQLLSFCVKRAARHGQRDVLEWIEETFSTQPFELLRHYDLHAIVKQSDSMMIQWLLSRKLGLVPARSLRFATEHGDVAMLRVLLVNGQSSETLRGEDLVTFAMRASQLKVVEFLVGDMAFGFTITTVEKAIALRQLAIAKCLLDHRANLRSSERANLVSSSLVQQLVGRNNLPMLAMLASVKNAASLGCTVMTCCHFARPSEDAVRLLLPLSSIEDTAVTLMRFAVRKQSSIVQTILTNVRNPLPPVVAAFVDRIMTDALGPLAMCAMAFFDSRKSVLMDDILGLVTKAERDDVLDTVLRFLPGPAFSLTAILKADAKRAGARGLVACDEPFLQLCLSLRQSEQDAHHKAIQQYLHTRKKPKSLPTQSVPPDVTTE